MRVKIAYQPFPKLKQNRTRFCHPASDCDADRIVDIDVAIDTDTDIDIEYLLSLRACALQISVIWNRVSA